MQKTVKEIIDMINRGDLHYNQSTQRKFVYADEPAKTLDGFVTTKAGSLINAILEQGIQLPAVYFWHNTDTNQLNIHDGKQRILSLYYFIKPTTGISICAWRNGKQTTYDLLDQADKDKLLNYTLDIVERTGNSEEEEKSFYLINTSALNLTKYECISGMLHGTFLDEFEKYIDMQTKTLDNVKPIGRGEQAYKILLTMFGLADTKKAAASDGTMLLLSDYLRHIRNNMFDPANYSLGQILEAFNELMHVIKGLKEDRGLAVATFMVQHNYDYYDVVNYYRQCMKEPNDIASWEIATHRTFINKYVLEGLKLDPTRFFSKDVKDTLFAKSGRCAHINEDGTRCAETSYSKLEVDHRTAWSKGGRTTIDNAQLLCKPHNASEGAKEDDK